MALDFLSSTDVAFEKSGISNITLPAPASASDGWALGVWMRLKSSVSDAVDRNFINQLVQTSTTTNGSVAGANNISIWWASTANTSTIDGTEIAAGKFFAAPFGWVAGDNSNAANWSDVTYTNDDVDRLVVLQLVNVAGSWKLRLYVTGKNATATLGNESPAVTPTAIPIAHIKLGDRIPSPGNRDWCDIAAQLFLVKRPLTTAEITQLATGAVAIPAVAAASDILGYWPAESAGSTLADASGNGNALTQVGGTASYAGFDFVGSAPASLLPAKGQHLQAAQSVAMVSAGTLSPGNGHHGHTASQSQFNLPATSLARPAPHGDVDLAASTITGASGASPVITLYGDPEANQNIPNSWHNLCARLDGLLGKTPQFSIANVHQWRNGSAANLGLPQRGWRPWWRASGGSATSWQRFDSYSVSGNSISFSNTVAFAVPSIEVAFFPPWNLDETNALFDAVYASSSGTEPPAAVAYRVTRPLLPLGTHNETAPVTSPDGIAVPALPMRSARITSSSSLAPDGLAKRRAVLLFNLHAQEASGAWVADRLIRTLISSDSNAVWLRDRFVIDCYSVNHTGLAGGASRGVVEGWSGSGDLPDPNRAWPAQINPPSGPLPEVNDVAAAIYANSGGKADVCLSFHSDALTSDNFGLAYYHAGWDALPAIKAFKDALLAAPSVATLVPTGDYMVESAPGLHYDVGFGRNILGAALSWVQEVTFATADYVTESQTLATRQIAALRQITETGLLPAPILPLPGLLAQQAQSPLLSPAAVFAPASSHHVHGVTSPLLQPAFTVVATAALHGQSALSPILIAAGNLLPSNTRLQQTASVSTLIAAGVMSASTARHSQIAGTAALHVAGSPPPHVRRRPVSSDRRTLKLRFS